MMISTQATFSWNFMISPKVIASWKVVIKKLKLLWYARFCSRHHWELPAATLSFSTFDSVSREFEQKKVLNFGTSLYFRHTQVSGAFFLVLVDYFWSCSRILFLRTFCFVFNCRLQHELILTEPVTTWDEFGRQRRFGSLHRSISFNHLSFIQTNKLSISLLLVSIRNSTI